jgi:hypothetical protein
MMLKSHRRVQHHEVHLDLLDRPGLLEVLD